MRLNFRKSSFKLKMSGSDRKITLVSDVKEAFQWKKARRITAINVGGIAVRLLTMSLDPNGENLSLELCTEKFLKPFSEKPTDEELNARQLETLKEAISSHSVPMGDVVIAFPRSLTTIRIVDFPSIKNDEIAEMIEYDAVKHIPYSIEEAQIDWSVISQSEETTTSKVLLVAANTNELDKHIDFYKKAGIDPAIIDVDIFGICEVYLKSLDPQKHLAVLDFGFSNSRIGMVHNGNYVFSRGILIGAEQYLEPSNDPHFGSNNFNFKNGLGRLSVELKRTLNAYRHESEGGRISKLYLCGEIAGHPGLSKKLEQELELSVETVSPVEKMPQQFADSEISKPEWALSLGLVLRAFGRERQGINLLRKVFGNPMSRQSRANLFKITLSLPFQ